MTADEALREMRALHDLMRAGKGSVSDMLPLLDAIEAELKKPRFTAELEALAVWARNEAKVADSIRECGGEGYRAIADQLAPRPKE